tara:strand:+ start:1604 stop:1807 length:204 start_codon:yes stop_codon:yes gene_type:complete
MLDLIWHKGQDGESLVKEEVVGKGPLVEVREVRSTDVPETRTVEMQRKCKSSSFNDLHESFDADISY